MKELLIFIVLTLLGLLIGSYTSINPIEESLFPLFTSIALVIGLYSSVSEIDVDVIRSRRWLAVSVVTIAVPVQIIVTGLIMYVINPVVLSFFVAVAITQIDPLSVNTLLQGKDSMSSEAKGILRVWASFDDPVTVLFGFLILLPLLSGVESSYDPKTILYGVIFNLLPSAILFLIKKYTKLLQNKHIEIVVVILILILAVYSEAYLSAALIGLLARPFKQSITTNLTAFLYYCVVFLVGMVAYYFGIELRLGFLLALVAYFVVQPIATFFMFSGTPMDFLRIAFAQQNGLTTLLMGVAFQSLGYDVLPILLPAIVIVNIFNIVVNKLFSIKERSGSIFLENEL